MNLHQAAHGDREFAFIESRLRVARKTVVGHWEDPYVHDRIAAWARAAAGWHEARHLRIARFGDNMRRVADTEGDKVEAQIRLRRRGRRLPGVASWSTRWRPRPTVTSTTSLASYDAAYEVAPELVRRRRAARRAARGGPDRGRAALVPDRRRLRRVHRHVRGSRRPQAAARDRRPAPDGRRLRVRGRGRLEERRAGPPVQGHGDAACPAGRRSWRTTPTTSIRTARRSSGRTCSRSVRRSPPAGRAARSTRCRSAARPTRSGSSSTPRPGRRSSPG